MIRDSVLLVAGVSGIGFQQITGNVSPLLIGVYMTMLGIPGLSSGVWLLKQIGESSFSSHQQLQSSADSQPPSLDKCSDETTA